MKEKLLTVLVSGVLAGIMGLALVGAAFLTLILASGCSHPTPPTPQPIDPTIYADDCIAIYQQELGRRPDPGGLANCEDIIVRARLDGNPTPQEVFRAFVRAQPEWKAYQDSLKVVVLPRLVPQGQFFVQVDGIRHTVIESTDLSLYAKYLDGIDIEPVLQQREDIGFNSVRIFGVSQNAWLGYQANLTPQRYGDRYYTELAPFFRKLAKHHLYASWVAFISNGEVPTLGGQLLHWDRLNAYLRDITNVRVSAINEDSAHPQSRLVSLFQLPKPVGVVSSHGSNGGSANGANGLPPPLPAWDWVELHTNDTLEWVRKVGKGCTSGELGTPNVPCIASENTRAPDRFQSLAEAEDAAKGAALLSAGSTFHSWTGRESGLWSGLELELAKAWVSGAKVVPLSCQQYAYRHDAEHQQAENWKNINPNGSWISNPAYDPRRPSFLRVYQNGFLPECRVNLRFSPGAPQMR